MVLVPMKQNREPRNKSMHLLSTDFWQGAKNTQWEKEDLFNKQYWKSWIPTCRKMKLGSYLTPYTSINSKWIIYLNLIPEAVKLEEENIWENYLDIGIGIGFMDMTSKAQAIDV